MIKVLMLRRFNFKGNQLGNIHAQILAELKNQSQTGMKKVSELIMAYPNVRDKVFLSSLAEISDYPEFTPVIKNLEPRIFKDIEQYSLVDLVNVTQVFSKSFLLSENLFSIIARQILSKIDSLTLFNAGTILYSIHFSNLTSPLLVEQISNKCLSLITTCDKDSLFKILKSFSLFPDNEFNKKALPVAESFLNEMTATEKINILELFWKLNIEAGSIENWIFSNFDQLNIEEFSLLVNKCSRCASRGIHYKEKILAHVHKLNPKNFSSKDLMYTVNGLHELSLGNEICKYFEDYLEQEYKKIELDHLCLIMYVFGINQKGSRYMWRRLIEIIKTDLAKFKHIDKVWALYGLYKVNRLKPDLKDLIISTMDFKEIIYKDLEKLIEICNGLGDTETLRKLKPVFLKNYKNFAVNKGLICIDAYMNAKIMDPELHSIWKFYKLKKKKIV